MRTLLPLVVLALCITGSCASLLAIDLGSEYLKVCLVKPGRTPISVVVNEMSRRKSPALVGFVGAERLIGEEAFSFAVRYPETIYQRARDLLGKDADDPTITRMLKEHGLPYDVVAHPNRNGSVASVKVNSNMTVSAEELVASLLYYARTIAEDHAAGPVPDAVITVPAFFGQRQRQALLDAASLAGLNVLGLVNTHTAAALQYGIERDFVNKSQTIVLYDQGSGSTEVALVKYTTYTVKEAGKPKVYNQLEIRDVDWEAEVGSNQLDMLLARHFAAQFSEKSGLKVDVMDHPKALAKLKKQVRRTKEMLSANSGAPMSVEELYEGRDFQTSITREEFEKLAGDYFTRSAAPLARLLARSGLQAADIDAVEVVGGGSRVPRLQVALSEALGGRGLDRHLDADEAVVLGAGLFAANLSTSFRLRKFGMVDMSMYSVSLSLDHIVTQAAGAGEEAVEAPAKLRNLLPYMKKLPNKRLVPLLNVSADPIKFSLAYNTSTPHGLPPGAKGPELAEFELTGVESVIKRYNTSGQVNLRFEADYSGLLRLDRVESVVEYTVMEEKILEVKEPEGNTTTAGADKDASTDGKAPADIEDKSEKKSAEDGRNSKEDSDKDEGENGDDKADSGEEKSQGEEDVPGKDAADSKAKEEVKAEAPTANTANSGNATDAGAGKNATTTIKRIQVPKVKIAKVPLTLGGRGWLYPAMGPADLATSATLISTWEKAEAAKRETARARNDLESYIIGTREKLETDELLLKVTTLEQREPFFAKLTEEEDWLYMEAAEDTGAPEFLKRLAALKAVGDPMRKRADESEQRPALVSGLKSGLELKRSIAKAWADTKPWITDKEREAAVQALDEFEKDLDTKVEAQSKKADHEDPVFTVAEVAAAWDKADKAYNKVANKRKPKPPPEPKPEKSEGDKADGDKKDGDASTDSGSESKQEKADSSKDSKDSSKAKQDAKGKDKDRGNDKDKKSSSKDEKDKDTKGKDRAEL